MMMAVVMDTTQGQSRRGVTVSVSATITQVAVYITHTYTHTLGLTQTLVRNTRMRPLCHDCSDRRSRADTSAAASGTNGSRLTARSTSVTGGDNAADDGVSRDPPTDHVTAGEEEDDDNDPGEGGMLADI